MSSPKVKGLWVAFTQDITEEGAEHLADAIRMLKYVSAVEMDDCVADFDDWSNREQIRREVEQTSVVVLRALLTGRVGYIHNEDKPKIEAALEKILTELREKK